MSPVVDRGDHLLQMSDFLVKEYQGEIKLNEDEYTEMKWVTPRELKELIETENNGEMGECTRNFLRYQGLIK